MGAENCNCKGNESSETAIVHRTPVKKAVNKMFNGPIGTPTIVDRQARDQAKIKTV